MIKNRIERAAFYIRVAWFVLFNEIEKGDSLWEGTVTMEFFTMATKRVKRSSQLAPHYDTLFGSRWTVWEEHLEWVAVGDEYEIKQWCIDIESTRTEAIPA